MSMNGKPLSGNGSASLFRTTASSHPLNYKAAPMRGGIRL